MAASSAQKTAAAAGIAAVLAAGAEGLRQAAYYDPAGILTVCYGSTVAVDPGKRYSIEECKARLDADMLRAVQTVEACTQGHADLTAHQLAAFGDAVYNIGPKVVCSRSESTLARLLYAGKVVEACQQLPRWDRATVAGVSIVLPGLTKRRLAEQSLCLTGMT